MNEDKNRLEKNSSETPVKVKEPNFVVSMPDESGIVDKYFLDHLYVNPFHNGAGKYFTIVSRDDDGMPSVIDSELPAKSINKIKTRLTFIKSEKGGSINSIEIKRFKYYKARGYVEQDECISFSFKYFLSLIGFLQSLEELNLDDIDKRRIPLQIQNGPDLDEETRKQFHTLVATDSGQALIHEVIKNGQLSGGDIANIAYRRKQLEVFNNLMNLDGEIDVYKRENNITSTGEESAWQHFFESNKWIFGYGLNFVFNSPLDGKKLELSVRGNDISGSGKRTDALLKTSGIVSSLCLVEIKTPNTKLLETDAYRADCWQSSKELSGGIAQSQKTTQKTVENLNTEFRPNDSDGNPTGEVLYTYKPKSFLIIGNLSEFTTDTGVNREKFGSFELLRRNMSSPEIITFDELFERAKFIVSTS